MLDHGFLKRGSRLYAPLAWLEHQINRQADALITSTHNAASLLRSSEGVDLRRLHTVVDGVNIERFRPFDGSPAWEAQRRELRAQLGIPEGRRIVVYLGLLAPYQGTNMLLDAARLLAPQMPDVHFLIMGYPDPASYRAYAESLGIGERVTLPGRIFYRDAHAYLALGDVAVAPKLSTTEGSGKISNYMAMGLPIVTFDTPVSREILGPAGYYAERGNTEDLAAQLWQALAVPEAAAAFGAAGRARVVADFSWEQGARQIETIYRQVLQPERAAPATGAVLPDEAASQQR
jgi:glycosyltransferase involved in cell wall biosynthesis